MFSTRDRAEHSRKRKIIAPVFSQKGVLEFEPILMRYVTQLIEQWDRLYGLTRRGTSRNGVAGGPKDKNGLLYLDLLPCEATTLVPCVNLYDIRPL